ncbi:MAG: hypothetical protein AAFO72_06600 [Pseudomonadota bacterium]
MAQVNPRSVDAAWLARTGAAVAAAAQRHDALQASSIARSVLTALKAHKCDPFKGDAASLAIIAGGFEQAVTQLENRSASGDEPLRSAATIEVLLLRFLEHELPCVGLSEARRCLRTAQSAGPAGPLRQHLVLLRALLGDTEAVNALRQSGSQDGAQDKWEAFVRCGAGAVADAPTRRGHKGHAPLWPTGRRFKRATAYRLEGENAPERLAQMVRRLTQRAPRPWLTPESFLAKFDQVEPDQQMAFARAVALPGDDLCIGAKLIVLTLAERVMTSLRQRGHDTDANVLEGVLADLAACRADAGIAIAPPSDAADCDNHPKSTKTLRLAVDRLLAGGQQGAAHDLLVRTATHADEKLAVSAIVQLADIGSPRQAHDLLLSRRTGKPSAEFLTAQARLGAYLGQEELAKTDLESYLAVTSRIGKSFRVAALLFLERYDEARAEAHLIQDADQNVSTILPAIGVALLAKRLDDADRYIAIALERLNDEPIDTASTLAHLFTIARFVRAVQHEALITSGHDISSLATLEKMILALLAHHGPLQTKSNDLLLKATLSTSSTLLELNHTARAQQILAVARRVFGTRLDEIYRIGDTYTNPRSSLDNLTALETRSTLGLVVTFAGTYLSNYQFHPPANEISANVLVSALHAAARLEDQAQLTHFGACASAILTNLREDHLHPVKGAARLAMAMAQHAVEPMLALSYLEDATRVHPHSKELVRCLAKAYRYTGELQRVEPLRARVEATMPFVAAELSLPGDDAGLRNRMLRCKAAFSPGDPGAVDGYLRDSKTIAAHQSWGEISRILHIRAPNTTHAQGIAFIASYLDRISPGLVTIPCAELQKSGVAVVPLFAPGLKLDPIGDDAIDQFNGILSDFEHVRGHPKHFEDCFFPWDVDWDQRRIVCLEMNFWQPIFEMIGRTFRCFRPDMRHPGAQELLRQSIVRLDRALFVCEKIFIELARENLPIRFVSRNWQYPPVAAFEIYCREKGWQRNMHFVAVGQGYEIYYSNLSDRYGSTAGLRDLTVHRGTRGPTFAVPERFAAWYEQQESAQFDTAVAQWIEMDRAGVGMELGPEAREVRRRVDAHRASGKPVIAVFGKILYDLAVPYMRGPAHIDIADWLDHTVRAAANSPALVLIKPHPQEIKQEIADRPREYFLDLAPDLLPDNVIVLGHQWFNIRDIKDMIDLGALWNGTTALELGASGIPVVVCDDWAALDYPVDHVMPRDRAHYEQIIRDPSIVTMPTHHQRRCAALLKYLSTPEVMRPYPFAECEITNAYVGPPVLNEAEVERYLRDGDTTAEVLARELNFAGTHWA